MIELSIDQITRVATDFRRKPLVEIRRKWPEVMPAKVRFSENGLVAPLAAGAVVTWVLRRKTDGLVLSTPAAATLVGSGATSYYETLFYFSTDAMNPLFANAELQRLECVIEVRWEQTGAGSDQRSITIPAIVERAENPGDLINAENVTGYPSAQVILDHIADDENPHAVTAAQVGAPTIAASESYTDAAEAAAISAAATDATTKANAAEAAAIQRANHTGTQAISTVSGLQTALDAKPPNTRTITAAGLATGGGDLSADRTITVSESGDTAIVDETESTTVISPRKWWQRLNFWIADTAAKTLGGNLTINGVDARLPNGGATFPTPESICTQARGDGRYQQFTELQNSNLTPFSFTNATLSGSVSVIAGGFLNFVANTLPATASAIIFTRESPNSANINFNRGGWISFSVANAGAVASDETRELVLGGQAGDVVGTLARQSLGVRRVRAAGGDELFAVARNAGGEITPISMGQAVGNVRTDITIIWDTAGNVQWLRNGAVVATTASGPTGTTSAALLIHQTHSGTGLMRGRWQPGYLYLP